jgi:hypothetical protein
VTACQEVLLRCLAVGGLDAGWRYKVGGFQVRKLQGQAGVCFKFTLIRTAASNPVAWCCSLAQALYLLDWT